MDTQQIKDRIKASLEMQVLRRNLIIVTVAAAFFIGFYALVNGGTDDFFWGFSGMIIVLMLLPMGIFCALRTMAIYRKPEGYIFCRGVLTQPHGGPVRDTVYYTAVLEDPENGGKFFVDTHAIFYTHGVISPTIEEYTNKTVTIAYNRETEMVVIVD